MTSPAANAHHSSDARPGIRKEIICLAHTTGQKDTRCNTLNRILTGDTAQRLVRKAHRKAQKSKHVKV
jgi:hypothetical protein